MALNTSAKTAWLTTIFRLPPNMLLLHPGNTIPTRRTFPLRGIEMQAGTVTEFAVGCGQNGNYYGDLRP